MRMNFFVSVTCCLLISFCYSVLAVDMKLTTPDGRIVLLKENGTWEFADTTHQNAATATYQSMDLIDLKIDIASLMGKKVKVKALGQLCGDMFLIKKDMMDVSPIIVETKDLPREQRKYIIQNCNLGAPVIIYGTVGTVMFQNGLIAEKIEW
ncbi:MAG: hypothetical protein BWY02_02135 [bacterium ADurb.Bin157]|nr:MAG: hypothetical protein BWY02_02135 [bacterium ADurb.Bin157]